MSRVEDERMVGAMGTKYRKTHNGEPVELTNMGNVLVGAYGLKEDCFAVPPKYLVDAGFIEPVPTVTVELDREVAESFVAAWRCEKPVLPANRAIYDACEAALNG